MIVSHKYKFIFIKTNKTAGTSVEIALSKLCGDEDIITPISKKDEKSRKQLGCRGPQNYAAPFIDYGLFDIVKFLLKGTKKCKFYNHMSAREIKEYVGDEIWNSYYKFCFERNPWDRLVSLYYWRCKSEPRPTISEFIDSGVPLILKRRGIDLYTIDGKIAVDKICRYEGISDELELIRAQLGIPEPLELPRAKSGFRIKKSSYRDLFDNDARTKIAELFHDEIEFLGYEF